MPDHEAPPVAEPSRVGFLRPSPLVCVVWLASRVALWTVGIVALTITRAFGYLDAPWWETWVFSPSVAWLLPPLHIAVPLLSYRGWGYQLREHDLLVRRGVLTREYVAVPLARVQQVDVTRWRVSVRSWPPPGSTPPRRTTLSSLTRFSPWNPRRSRRGRATTTSST